VSRHDFFHAFRSRSVDLENILDHAKQRLEPGLYRLPAIDGRVTVNDFCSTSASVTSRSRSLANFSSKRRASALCG